MPQSLWGTSSHPWLLGVGLVSSLKDWGRCSCLFTTLCSPHHTPKQGRAGCPPDVLPKGPWGRLTLLPCLPSPLCDPTENPGDRGGDPALQQGQVLQRELHENHLVPQVGWPCPGALARLEGAQHPPQSPVPRAWQRQGLSPVLLSTEGVWDREQLLEAQKGGSPGKVGTLALRSLSQNIHGQRRTIVLEHHLGTGGEKDAGTMGNQMIKCPCGSLQP